MQTKQSVCLIAFDYAANLLSCTTRFSSELCFPGGKVDEGETLEQALVRETKEGTGISLDPKLLLPVYEAVEEGYLCTAFFYAEPVIGPKDKWTVEPGIWVSFEYPDTFMERCAFKEYNAEALQALLHSYLLEINESTATF